MKVPTKDMFNIPNILCYIRILLIPFFSYFIISAKEDNIYRIYIAAGLILLSGLTDWLDGFIARRFNMITAFGSVLDPIADKLTQFMIAVSLATKDKYVLVLVVIVFVKEIVMGICCLILLKQKKRLEGALWYGKVSTFVFYAVMIAVLALSITGLSPDVVDTTKLILVAVASGFMLFSFVRYLVVFYKMGKTFAPSK